MKKIKNIVREVLNEEMGVQTEIKKMSKVMANLIIKSLKVYLKSDGLEHSAEASFSYPNKIDKKTIDRTGISGLKVNVLASKEDKDKLGGKFSPKKVLRTKDGFHIEVDLNIDFVDDISIHENGILSVINHELNHAFVYIKKYDKPSKLNKNKGMMKFEFGGNPELLEFLKMIYLSIPEESQARVQEAGAMLDEIDADNYRDAIRELYRYQPIKDASIMSQYKVDKVLKVQPELLSRFIKSFELNNKAIGGSNKTYGDTENFFRYFEKDINNKGDELNRKILKLVASKFNNEDRLLNEGGTIEAIMYYLHEDEDLFKNIFGYVLDDIV